MKKRIIATSAIALAILAGTIPASPAAAAITCSAARPVQSSGGQWDLLNTRVGSYAGKPFSFRLTIVRNLGMVNEVRTFSPTARSYRTGKMNRGTAVKLESWYAGTKCATWNRY